MATGYAVYRTFENDGLVPGDYGHQEDDGPIQVFSSLKSAERNIEYRQSWSGARFVVHPIEVHD